LERKGEECCTLRPQVRVKVFLYVRITEGKKRNGGREGKGGGRRREREEEGGRGKEG
jgi:hypothetical protein